LRIVLPGSLQVHIPNCVPGSAVYALSMTPAPLHMKSGEPPPLAVTNNEAGCGALLFTLIGVLKAEVTPHTDEVAETFTVPSETPVICAELVLPGELAVMPPVATQL